ncbi:hypothetical protein [Paenibacillus paeoniae]|nr:hypothetical protein [Paenibacillus paeoniae]
MIGKEWSLMTDWLCQLEAAIPSFLIALVELIPVGIHYSKNQL